MLWLRFAQTWRIPLCSSWFTCVLVEVRLDLSNTVRLSARCLWDRERQSIVRSGKEILLSDMEFRLLQELFRKRNQIVPTSDLIYALWNTAPTACRANLANLIYRLRNHLGDRSLIMSVHGVGYMLRVSQDYLEKNC
ncbi:helix-turn-helix domain-containing protein [Alicyclobacillus mali (ex Roth et al. 2021)]|uniref:helix-turn-helix domain-containing protein n=1 Tax=Alicyclobacillus mali (ex Roth et al. 2021) TaxID=1123961 RepID=UPI0009EA0DAB